MVTHGPQRTCVGCRARAPRASLVRVARGPAGIALDLRTSAPGRGAWLHRDRACVDAAIAKGMLARALRTGLAAEELGRLRDDIETGVA